MDKPSGGANSLHPKVDDMVIKGVQVPHWKPVEKAICSGNRDPKVVPAQLEGHPKGQFRGFSKPDFTCKYMDRNGTPLAK